MKHLIGAGLVTALAFILRFALPLSIGVDIHVHDAYRVVPLRVASFWALLVISAVWFSFAALRLIRHGSYLRAMIPHRFLSHVCC